MAEKFESIEDARDFINGQLVTRGFLKSDQTIQINGEAEDAKLIINTINRLLKTIRSKDEQLSEWQAKDRKEQKTAIPVTTPAVAPRRSRRSLVLRRPGKRVEDGGVRKIFKAQTNRLQSTIEELRDRIQRDQRDKETDITWRVHQDLTTAVPRSSGVDVEDQLTLLLQRQSSQQALCAELVIFLDNVNRFTYSSAILGITEVSLREQHQAVLDKLRATGDRTMVDLVDFISDWYQIIDLEPEGT